MEASSIKVLLIDDEPELLNVSKQFLELDRSIFVDTSLSATDALKLIGRREYDVIVSDYQMPMKDGIQLLKEIRSVGNKIPFIIFTGKGREEVAIAALNAGADFYLQKGGHPTSQFAELSNMIKQAYSKREGERALGISEERYRSLFENSSDAVILTAIDFDTILFANPSACALFQATEDELRKDGLKELIVNEKDWEIEHHKLSQIGIVRREFTFKRKDGTTFNGETTSGLLNGSFGIARISMIIRDITERKLADHTIHESEVRFRTYIDNAPEGIFVVDSLGNYQDANKTACSILKYSREELLKLNIADISAGSRSVNPLSGFNQLKEKGSIGMEIVLLRKDGVCVPMLLNAVELPDKRYLAFCSDITDRKRVEAALQVTESRFDQLAEQSNTVTWEADIDGLFTYVSSVSKAVWGYRPDELVGKKHFYDLVVEAEREAIKSKAFEMLKHKKRFVGLEHAVQAKDGRTLWNSTSGIPLLNVDGTLRGYLGSDTDITERKHAEDALRESEKRYHLLFDHVGVGVAVYEATEDGRDFIFTDFSRGAQEIEKLRKKDVIGRKVTEIFPGIDEMGLLDVFMRVHRTGNPESYPTSLYHDGRTMNYRKNYVYKSPSGEVVAVYEDATAMKEMVRRIEHLASFPMLDPAPVLELKVGGEISYANEAAHKVIRDMGMGDDPSLLLPKDIEDITKVLKNSGATHAVRKVEVGPRAFNASILNMPGTDLVRVYETDITQLVHLEGLLLESERKYYTLFDLANDAILLQTLTVEGEPSHFIEVNQVASSILGYSKEELLSMGPLDIVPPELHPQLADIVSQAQTKDTFLFETKFRRKDGTVISVESSAHLMDHQGRKIWISHIRDITKRKQNEEALEYTKERYESLYNQMLDCIYISDLEGNNMNTNAALLALLGYTKEEMSSLNFFSMLDPEQVPKMLENVEEIMRTGSQKQLFEIRLRCKNGEYVNLEASASIVYEKGAPYAIQGVARDITERKQMDQALRETNRKLNLLSSITRHDIKNQLMALDGNLTLLSMKELDPASEELLRKSNSALSKISAMIHFTKEYEDVGVKAPFWQNLRELITREARGVALGPIKLVNGVPANIEVYADPLITKVFHNLIDNAVRHGGKVTTIHFFVEEHDGSQTIICEDDGVGIPSDMKGELFTRDSKNKHGFGLFLSREILAITGIGIEERGHLKQGAKFILTIPLEGWKTVNL